MTTATTASSPQVVEVDFTGALVPAHQDRAEAEATRRMQATHDFAELVTGMTRPVGGGFRMVFVTREATR